MFLFRMAILGGEASSLVDLPSSRVQITDTDYLQFNYCQTSARPMFPRVLHAPWPQAVSRQHPLSTDNIYVCWSLKAPLLVNISNAQFLACSQAVASRNET